MALYECFIDGAARNNGMNKEKLQAACAVVIYEDRKQIALRAKNLGALSNNQAEYEALDMCLLMCRMGSIINPIIYSDSRVVVNQVNGEWDVKEAGLIPFYLNINEIRKDYNFKLVWVPRKKVFIPNDLCNKSLDRLKAAKTKFDVIEGTSFNEFS